MKRKLLRTLTLGLLLLWLPIRCHADQTGSLRVALGQAGQVTQGGSVTLYRVGSPISGGYRLTDGFGGGVIAWEDVYSQALADWLTEQASYGGTELLLDADGYADFPSLSEGLYLLVQKQPSPGYQAMEPFLVPLPYEGQWDIQANPKCEPLSQANPQTGQRLTPVLCCLMLPVSGLGVAVLVKKRRFLEKSP